MGTLFPLAGLHRGREAGYCHLPPEPGRTKTVRGAGQPAHNAGGDFIPSMISWRRLDVCGDSVTAVT
jgi:hypothetical protein